MISVSLRVEEVAAALQVDVGCLWRVLVWGWGLTRCSPALTAGAALICLGLLPAVAWRASSGRSCMFAADYTRSTDVQALGW